MMYSKGGNKRRGVVLQARDRKLLQELALMRVIDREQAKTIAGFGSTTRVNARLLALVRAGLLRRFLFWARLRSPGEKLRARAKLPTSTPVF